MSALGFVGLGIMGRPMALNLIKGGHRLHLHSRSGVPKDLVEAGGVACANGMEVAQRSDVVFTMVPDTPHVADVLFGAAGVAEGLSPGKIVVDMSSISPVDTKRFAERIGALGCRYLDAPVSGGEVGAKAGTLTIMVGGPEDTFENVRPLFELMGKNVSRVGANGDGQTCKVANQIVVALNIEAVAEALLFASKMGADPARVRQALLGGFAASRVLEVHGERMLKRTFDPGFRIELHQKDLNLALSNARQVGMSLPNTATAQAARPGTTRRSCARSSSSRATRLGSEATPPSQTRARAAELPSGAFRVQCPTRRRDGWLRRSRSSRCTSPRTCCARS